MQSKDGPLRVHRMNSKLQNRKLTSRWSKNDEEQTKDDEERSQNWSQKCYESVTEAPRPCFFFFFLLLLTNFTQILLISGVGPFLQPPSRLFIGNEGWRLHSSSPRRAACFLQKKPSSPRRAGYFIPKLSSGPRGWKMPQKWPFWPSFEYFAYFLPKHHKTLWIARQLVLSSSIRLARIQMLANEGS